MCRYSSCGVYIRGFSLISKATVENARYVCLRLNTAVFGVRTTYTLSWRVLRHKYHGSRRLLFSVSNVAHSGMVSDIFHSHKRLLTELRALITTEVAVKNRNAGSRHTTSV